MQRSLTVRLALLFALLSLVLLGTVGTGLYHELEKQLALRDDAALVTRVDQIRTLLQDANSMDLIRNKPRLFENMLGNPEALLVLRFSGEKPLIEVNPGKVPIPEVPPVSSTERLTLSAVQHTVDAHDVPFIAVAADAHTTESKHSLQIIAGRVMSERTRLLESYRDRIVLLVVAGTGLAALAAFFLVRLGLRPLRKLASQTESIGITNLNARVALANAPSELSPLVDAFNAMLDRLATGFAQMSQLTADMAHDLRTPIANLLGQTEVALGIARSAEYYEALIASNFEEFQRLSRMMDNMLFLARSEHPEATIEHAHLDVASEYERVTDYFEGLAAERSLQFEANGYGTVWADPVLLRRALANLVANAVQYADPDTTILLGCEADGSGTRIWVENTGDAIPQSKLPRLFDRFYRADTARRGSSQSSGMGLSIVRTIMTLHRGRSTAFSTAGQTRFILFFPACRTNS
ncbi:MAG: heavy metal sensor histidine kinase [Burkholderiaceae bacterium]